MILGIAGRKGSGKSTVAEMLVKRGWVRQPFAKPLKDMIDVLLLQRGVDAQIRHRMLWGDLKEAPHPALNGRTARHAMQVLGTEWGRDLIHPDLWIDAWRDFAARPGRFVVADDLRFDNEAKIIRELGGKVWLINRWPDHAYDVVHGDMHISEQSLSPELIDTQFYNEHTIEWLREITGRQAVLLERAVDYVPQHDFSVVAA